MLITYYYCSGPRLHNCCGEWDGLDPINWFNHISLVAIICPTNRPKSVCNRCVIEVFGGVSVLSRCFFGFSVGVGAFVIGLSVTRQGCRVIKLDNLILN